MNRVAHRRVSGSRAVSFTALGALLGVGSPAGALLLRLLLGGRPLPEELAANAFFYLYTLIATVLVFSVAGWLAGYQIDRMRAMEQRMRELAEIDALTKLSNVRAFQRRYSRTLEHARRFREPLSLLFIDVDHLKSINDLYGHATGSAALVHIAGVLIARKREVDDAARWGGDEFVVLLPGADAVAAQRLAENIVTDLRNTPLIHAGQKLTVTVTIGISTAFPGEPHGDLLDEADALLSKGKRLGRNRFVASNRVPHLRPVRLEEGPLRPEGSGITEAQ